MTFLLLTLLASYMEVHVHINQSTTDNATHLPTVDMSYVSNDHCIHKAGFWVSSASNFKKVVKETVAHKLTKYRMEKRRITTNES